MWACSIGCIALQRITLMAKKILLGFLFTLLMGGLPQVANAASAIEIVDNEAQAVSVSVSNEGVLRVTGAAGQTLYVYNITGVRVLSVKVDGSDKSYNLNLSKGCYIVKVGKTVRKISIR